MLRPRNPPNPEIQIHQYKFKFNQDLNLSLFRKIPRNVSFWIWWISVMQNFMTVSTNLVDLQNFITVSTESMLLPYMTVSTKNSLVDTDSLFSKLVDTVMKFCVVAIYDSIH